MRLCQGLLTIPFASSVHLIIALFRSSGRHASLVYMHAML